jgi:hypothetical protein
MECFPNGVRVGDNEEHYQAALRANANGFVLTLNPGKYGKAVVHHATCRTIAYPMPSAKGHDERSPRYVLPDMTEVDAALQNAGLERGQLHHCSKCFRKA